MNAFLAPHTTAYLKFKVNIGRQPLVVLVVLVVFLLMMKRQVRAYPHRQDCWNMFCWMLFLLLT